MVSAAALAFILFLAGLVFGITGFGFGVVALPLLSLFLPLKTALAFQFPYAVSIMIFNVWRYYHRVKYRRLWPVILGAVLTIPLGVWFLHRLPEVWMIRSLAVFIIVVLMAGRVGFGSKVAHLTAGSLGGVIWGMLSGVFQGAYTVGGPATVIYIMATTPEPESAKGELAVCFFAYAVMSLVLYGLSGLFTAEWLLKSVLYSPAVASGMALGTIISGWVSKGGYYLAVDTVLFLTAVMLWLKF